MEAFHLLALTLPSPASGRGEGCKRKRKTLLVPAAVSMFGRWNWILPSMPARLLRVKPSLPGRAAAGEGEAG